MKRRFGIKLLLALAIAMAAVTLLSGCGRAKKESSGAISTTTTTIGVVNTGGAPVIGFTECYKCHADGNNPASFPTVFGDSAGSIAAAIGWLNGPHGNNETYDATTHAQTDNRPTNPGMPYYGYFSDSTCAQCHDPLNEGTSISKFFTASGDATLGMVDRPVIGCEACHGGGGNHFGMGPMPFAKPDQDRCGQCHNAGFPDGHLTYHPEGDTILEDYKASKHASSINTHTYLTDGDSSVIRARCSRCHTDEGARLYVPVTSGTATYGDVTSSTANLPNISNASAVQCRTCHDGHNPLNLLGEEDAVAPAAWSEEFKTCTQCHQLLKADGSLNDQAYHTPYSSGGTTINKYGSLEEIIPDTHYDNPNTPTVSPTDSTAFTSNTGGIEGYVIVPSATHSGAKKNNNTGTCRDCHNPHKADNTINKQWARSAHGGKLLEKKEAATNAYTAASLDSDAPAWIHYNWKANTGGRDTLGRQVCQRCHTSTGFRNFANDQAAYDANGDLIPDTTNDFSHLSGGQAELLYCWACHTDNVGGMRNPGAIKANYGVINYTTAAPKGVPLYSAKVSYQYPDVSKSNVCMGCHTGRENGESIAALNTDPTLSTFDLTNNSFINSHYLTAGGTVFTATGYEYSGQTYTNLAEYKHDTIGVSAANTGSSGPCVGCHMTGTESHLFLPVTKDANETITAVASTMCVNCHTDMSVTKLENAKKLSDAAMAALEVQLQQRGMFFGEAHPYFYTSAYDPTYVESTATVHCQKNQAVKNWQTGGTSTFTWSGTSCTSAVGVAGTADTGKNNMGAAFNYNLLKHDPGAYAHNKVYAKRLIYDAIDWLDDNSLNGSVAATLDAAPHAGATYQADAKAYLLPRP